MEEAEFGVKWLQAQPRQVSRVAPGDKKELGMTTLNPRASRSPVRT